MLLFSNAVTDLSSAGNIIYGYNELNALFYRMFRSSAVT